MGVLFGGLTGCCAVTLDDVKDWPSHPFLMDLDIDLLPLSSDDDNDYHHPPRASALLPEFASTGWSKPDFLVDDNASDDFASLNSDASLPVTASREADDWDDDFDAFFDDEIGNELPESSSERWRDSNVKIKIEKVEDDDIMFFDEEEEEIGDKQNHSVPKIEKDGGSSVICEESDYVEAGRTIPRSR